jgi:hypothetical protein
MTGNVLIDLVHVLVLVRQLGVVARGHLFFYSHGGCSPSGHFKCGDRGGRVVGLRRAWMGRRSRRLTQRPVGQRLKKVGGIIGEGLLGPFVR